MLLTRRWCKFDGNDNDYNVDGDNEEDDDEYHDD